MNMTLGLNGDHPMAHMRRNSSLSRLNEPLMPLRSRMLKIKGDTVLQNYRDHIPAR